MADLLLSKGYTVVGIIRPSGSQPWRLSHLNNEDGMGYLLPSEGISDGLLGV
jgi:GDP-D-mannose dehydratase